MGKFAIPFLLAFVLLSPMAFALANDVQNGEIGYLQIIFQKKGAIVGYDAIEKEGVNGIDYSYFEGGIYFANHLDGRGMVLLQSGPISSIEFSNPTKESVEFELGYLKQKGVLANFEKQDIGEVSEWVGQAGVNATLSIGCCTLTYATYSTTADVRGMPPIILLGLPSPMQKGAVERAPGQKESMAVPVVGKVPEKSAVKAEVADTGMDVGKHGPDIPYLMAIIGLLLVASIGIYMFAPQARAVFWETPQIKEALRNPTRMKIIKDLEGADRIPTDISNRVGKSKATISEHLSTLVKAGLVEKVHTPGKKFVYYRLSAKGKIALLRRKAA